MRMNKILAGILTAILLSLSASSAFAAEGIGNIISEGKKQEVQKEEKLTSKVYYKSFTGTVKEITVSETEADVSYVLVENKEGAEANFIVSKNTYRINDEEIRIGSVITGYYDANKMMIMIYPPQYEAEILEVAQRKFSVMVDYFDHKLVSSDGSLRLNIGKDTKVVYKDGTVFKGNPIKRNLVVLYDTLSKSIPALTEPIKVIVLTDKKAVEEAEPPVIIPDRDYCYGKWEWD